jgi:hypothetical protein
MLLPEHAMYHKFGPKDLKWDGEKVSEFAVTRTTSATGEQCQILCPIFKDDSRDDMMNRIHMCYSILQERMEDENKVTLALEEKAKQRAQDYSLRKEAKDRNKAKYERELKEVRRQAHKEKWPGDKIEAAEKELAERFHQAQVLIDENPIEAPVVEITSGEAKEG